MTIILYTAVTVHCFPLIISMLYMYIYINLILNTESVDEVTK